jgi:hypothetical protein
MSEATTEKRKRTEEAEEPLAKKFKLEVLEVERENLRRLPRFPTPPSPEENDFDVIWKYAMACATYNEEKMEYYKYLYDAKKRDLDSLMVSMVVGGGRKEEMVINGGSGREECQTLLSELLDLVEKIQRIDLEKRKMTPTLTMLRRYARTL